MPRLVEAVRKSDAGSCGDGPGWLSELADWLRCERVELVAMEATSAYWKQMFYLLETEGLSMSY